jgi:hypothetical protein
MGLWLEAPVFSLRVCASTIFCLVRAQRHREEDLPGCMRPHPSNDLLGLATAATLSGAHLVEVRVASHFLSPVGSRMVPFRCSAAHNGLRETREQYTHKVHAQTPDAQRGGLSCAL